MNTVIEARNEEREARKRQRELDRLQRARAKAQQRAQRSRLAQVIREELAKPRAKACRCGITTRTTKAELYDLAEGCTGRHRGGGGFICPTLDAIRRRI